MISVSSLSKAYGVPGIRTGWLITRDPALQEIFLAAHEQINICGSVIDEWIAEQVMEKRAAILGPTLAEMRRRLARGQRLDGRRGAAGVGEALRRRGLLPANEGRAAAAGRTPFYRRLLEGHGAYVGPGHWFEMPDTALPRRLRLAGLRGPDGRPVGNLGGASRLG